MSLDNNILSIISDTLIERPISFSYQGHHYLIFPPSLGKIQLCTRLISIIGLTDYNKDIDFYLNCLLKVKKRKEDCIRLLSYYTLEGADCLNENRVERRVRAFKGIADEDLASLLITILSFDKTADIIKYFGIDKETEKIERVMSVKKKDKNSLSFAGKSVWGSLIDPACERYGWSYQYVLWGISYANLRLLLADQIKTVYLSDDERKQIPAKYLSDTIRIENTTELEKFIKMQSWR